MLIVFGRWLSSVYQASTLSNGSSDVVLKSAGTTMYFPIGWPKVIKIPESGQGVLKQIKCNRDRILVAILTEDSLAVWFCKVRLQ